MRKHWPVLDGIRGLAALAVVEAHAWGRFNFGAAAVSFFFVLSAFLLGGNLMDGAQTPGVIQRFYIRRTLRIWPLYFVAVAYIFATSTSVELQPSPWLLLVFLGNVWWLVGAHHPWATVLWSIAIEEHFYVIAPWLITKIQRSILPAVCLVLAASGIALRFLVAMRYKTPLPNYVLLPCRMDAFALGVVAAWGVRERTQWNYRIRIACLLALLAEVLVFDQVMWMRNDAWFAQLIDTMLPALLLWVLATGQWSFLGWFLSLPPFRWLGEMSYGLYLLHGPVIELLEKQGVGHERTLALFLTTCAITIPVAWASARWFERPIQRLRWAPRPVARVHVG